MEKKSNLSGIKKEFLEELNKVDIDVQDLRLAKIPKGVLETEVALRKIFGDEIYVKQKSSEEISGVKEIIKLTDEDIAFDAEVQRITDDLVDVDFETNVNVILSKIAEQEEE